MSPWHKQLWRSEQWWTALIWSASTNGEAEMVGGGEWWQEFLIIFRLSSRGGSFYWRAQMGRDD